MFNYTFLIPVFNLKGFRYDNFLFTTNKIRGATDNILIIEQVSDIKAASKIKDYAEKYNIKYHSVHDAGNRINKSKLINIGTKLIDTEYIWVNDADCLLKFNKLIKDLESSRVNHDFIQPYENVEFIDSVKSKQLRKDNPVECSYKNQPYAHMGCMYGALSFIFKKSAFIDLGMFNENFLGWGHEDTEFCYRLITNNKDIHILFESYGVHLYHPIYSNKNRGDLVLNSNIFLALYSASSIEKITAVISNYYIEMFKCKPLGIGIITLFRGNIQLLRNIFKFYNTNLNTIHNINLTWIVNSSNILFRGLTRLAKYKLQKKYNIDILIIYNKAISKRSKDNYFTDVHSDIGKIYTEVLADQNSRSVIILEDDVTPPDDGINLLINSFFDNTDASAIAAVYIDRNALQYANEGEKVCGKFEDDVHNNLAYNLISNSGIYRADRIPGGFTIYNTSHVKANLPVYYDAETRVGWDWLLSSRLLKSGNLYLDTDISCIHHI